MAVAQRSALQVHLHPNHNLVSTAANWRYVRNCGIPFFRPFARILPKARSSHFEDVSGVKNLSSEGEVLADVFTIQNNAEGFDTLLQTIHRCTSPESKIKVGLEATGHYSYNILGFLLNEGLPTYLINPLHTNLYRKSLSLRKTRTDRVDARTIAAMLMSDVDLKPYTDTAYHNEELKSLTIPV